MYIQREILLISLLLNLAMFLFLSSQFLVFPFRPNGQSRWPLTSEVGICCGSFEWEPLSHPAVPGAQSVFRWLYKALWDVHGWSLTLYKWKVLMIDWVIDLYHIVDLEPGRTYQVFCPFLSIVGGAKWWAGVRGAGDWLIDWVVNSATAHLLISTFTYQLSGTTNPTSGCS